ncbi:hypothetical protein Bccel_4621 [Pseudobacteroides cellulosolvens ATCC 35603 = DSM 2933]|uniref:Uncharacterized protein n=1 Tax=Pseudobacteroides cellulosolvens ATCC 35603 = DSM 2933 TaxID=398512 RepID=A0A0L6JV92_9FIRM|nr:hypothetical protein Bccel_4621 [Pseudobacteroides cellulosolvens ATCC 35603 = DSM 2933]
MIVKLLTVLSVCSRVKLTPTPNYTVSYIFNMTRSQVELK